MGTFQYGSPVSFPIAAMMISIINSEPLGSVISGRPRPVERMMVGRFGSDKTDLRGLFVLGCCHLQGWRKTVKEQPLIPDSRI